MALRRAHTRANKERPPATLVADPEKIIGRGRALQRKTSKAGRTSRSGILRGTASLYVPGTPSIKSTSVEASCSQKTIVESQNPKGDEPSLDSAVINPFPENFSAHSLGK